MALNASAAVDAHVTRSAVAMGTTLGWPQNNAHSLCIDFHQPLPGAIVWSVGGASKVIGLHKLTVDAEGFQVHVMWLDYHDHRCWETFTQSPSCCQAVPANILAIVSMALHVFWIVLQ